MPGAAGRHSVGIGEGKPSLSEGARERKSGRDGEIELRGALTTLGVWPSVAMQLAPAEDVRQALAFVARGEAPLGIVYATDARAEPRVRVAGTFPETTHPPIRYPVALTTDAQPAAADFLRYLRSPAASALFAKAGFQVLAGR
jgi:molybdate transport system substrate-binding protein